MAFTDSRSGAFLDRATNTKAHQKEMSLTGSRRAPRLLEKNSWDQPARECFARRVMEMQVKYLGSWAACVVFEACNAQ